MLSGTLIYMGVFILFATLSFWTIQSVDLAYVLTNTTLELFQYPIEIYGAWLRRFFTFIVQPASITYYPLIVILDAHLLPCPLAASGFALACRLTQAEQPHLRRRSCHLLPVRRVVSLPVASFGPRLATVALAFSWWAGAASPTGDFHPI